MDIESVVDEIIEVILRGDQHHSDPFTQERIIRSEVWNVLEEFESSIRAVVHEELGVEQ